MHFLRVKEDAWQCAVSSDVVFKILILIATLGCKKYRLSPKLENKTQHKSQRGWTRRNERELLTIWRNHSRQNISCANCRKFQRQRATPTWISDMPVLRSAYKIVRKRNRQRDKLDRYVSDTAQATAMLVRIELSWVYLLEMGRLIATKKRLWLSGWFFTL